MEKRKEAEESLRVTPEKITTSGGSVTSAHGSHMGTSRVAKCSQRILDILQDAVFAPAMKIQILNEEEAS